MDQRLKDTGIVLSNRASRPDDLYGTISLHWYGITHTAEVIFEGTSLGHGPNELQIHSFCDLVMKWDDIQGSMKAGILRNRDRELSKCRLESGSRGSPQDDSQLANRMALTGIVVSYMDGQEWCNYIGLLAECPWSPEHGIGIKIVNGQVVEIGYQDIVT